MNRSPMVRKMVPDDRGPLVDLWVASWRETMPDIDFDARRAWIAAVLADPGHEVLVVALEDVVQGFAVLDDGVLQQLAVAPSAKGHGLASTLLAKVKALATDGLALEVNQGNPRAVRFYRREGFRITGEGRNPGSGLATWHMRWR